MKIYQITLAVVAVFILFLLFALWPFAMVGAGERGVVLDFGAFHGAVMEPGLHWRTPVAQQVVKVDIQTHNFTLPESETYSKDLQVVKISSALNYNLDPHSVGILYQTIGLDYEAKVIRPQLEAAVKQTLAKYSAEELLKQRGQVQDEIQGIIRGELATSNITVTKYSLVNESFSDDYEKAIEQKQVAEQSAKKAEYDTQIAEQTKQQAIKAAEAVAETTKLQAAALASQQGSAVIEKIKADAMLQAAKNWNGIMPTTVISGIGSPLPLLNLPGVK